MTKDKGSADSLPAMLTLKEAAPLLRVAVRTLQDPEWHARLKAVRVGRKWLVPRDVVDQLLRGQR